MQAPTVGCGAFGGIAYAGTVMVDETRVAPDALLAFVRLYFVTVLPPGGAATKNAFLF